MSVNAIPAGMELLPASDSDAWTMEIWGNSGNSGIREIRGRFTLFFNPCPGLPLVLPSPPQFSRLGLQIVSSQKCCRAPRSLKKLSGPLRPPPSISLNLQSQFEISHCLFQILIFQIMFPQASLSFPRGIALFSQLRYNLFA